MKVQRRLGSDGSGRPLIGRRLSLQLAVVLPPLAPDAEITLEANPGTGGPETLRDFRAAGINRLSLGVQSFDTTRLTAIGRIHGGGEARRAVEAALCCFDNVNLDLPYGLPAQALAGAVSDVETAISYAPQHVSAYHLTLEPGTAFYRAPPPLPDEDAAVAMQEEIEARLAAAGYEHYETCAFARRQAAMEQRGGAGDVARSPLPGPSRSTAGSGASRCRHNLNYWSFGDYLGIGAGAHGKLSCSGCIVREARLRHPARYVAAERGDAVEERREVAPEALPFEFMMNALRLNAGFPVQLYEERTGMPLATVREALEEARRRGLLVHEREWIAPTALGRRLLNGLLQLFLPQNRAG